MIVICFHQEPLPVENALLAIGIVVFFNLIAFIGIVFGK